MSTLDPILEAAAQFAHDDVCGCWEGSPKGTPLPGLLNPEDVEDRTDPEFFAQGYASGCTMDEPEHWEDRAVATLAFLRPLITAEAREAVAREIEAHQESDARCCDQVAAIARGVTPLTDSLAP